jgi:hypothetical protein
MPLPTSGTAFFVFDPIANDVQERNDKIVPDPVILGETEIILDGKKEVITATSGQEHYVVVEPGDYPTDADGRQQRRGAERTK